jgi:integrase
MAKELLNARRVEQAKPRARPYRLLDGEGLTLFVAPTGVKSWQFRYTLAGKQQTATLGKYPTVPLVEARKRAEAARNLADEGRHVTVEKRVAKAKRAADREQTFEAIAKAWVAARRRQDKWTEGYVREVENSLANHLEQLNGLPVSAITAAIAAPLLSKIERSAPDMERKVRQRLRAILDYAVMQGLIVGNPIPNVRRRRLDRAHYAAEISHAGVGNILRAADAVDVGRGVRRAHALLVFLAQRVGEIVPAEWSEVDLEAATWSIPRTRMKRKDQKRGDHVVPLPRVLLAAMKEWRRADGDDARYVCPSPRGEGPITREATEKFYRITLDLAGKHSPHSWRTVFSTWARDAGKDRDAVEAQLDHVTGNVTETSYDRAQRLDRRRELLAWHEASLLAARDGAEVLPFNAKAKA